jgi:hypothetical protein
VSPTSQAGSATDADDERRPPRVRARWPALLLDIGVVVVIVGFAIAFFGFRAQHHRDDGDARAIAKWARSHDVERIAWPRDLRGAVPALLAAKTTPVLVDPSTPAQAFALNQTGVVVTHDDAPRSLAGIERARRSFGALDAHLIDLGKAAFEPLPAGAVAEVEIARPYLYAPLRDSVDLQRAPLSTTLVLAPGRYRFEADVFAPHGGDATLRAVTGSQPIADRTVALAQVVQRPTPLDFEVAGAPGSRSTVTITVTAGPGSRAFLHAWRVRALGS